MDSSTDVGVGGGGCPQEELWLKRELSASLDRHGPRREAGEEKREQFTAKPAWV